MCAAKLGGDHESVCLLKNGINLPKIEIRSCLSNCDSNAPVDERDGSTLIVCRDRDWLHLEWTNGVVNTAHQSEKFVKVESFASLRSLTESVHIEMPEDITFANMDVKLCKMRWLMKVCVLISLTLVNLQWFEYTIVSHTITSYYNTSADLVNWTSMIYMLCYVVFTFPVSFLLDNRVVNLRIAMIVCVCLLLGGSFFKAISVNLVDFRVAFLGQVLVALAQVIILNIPSQLAFEWFAVQEKTLICNLSIFGMQLGLLLGFAITPWLVDSHNNEVDIASKLDRLNYLYLVFTLLQLILVVWVFRALPQSPPCYLQAIQKKSRSTKRFFWKTFMILIKSCDFKLLNLAFGLQMGVVNTLFTLINPMVLTYLPESQSTAGLIGVTIIAGSLFSSLVMILILRRQRHLKFMAILTAGMAGVSVIIFIVGLLTGTQILLYLSALSLGIFGTAFQTTGYEFAFETTFPESEGTVSGVLNVSAQIFGILTTTLVTTAYSSAGHMTGNLLLIAIMMLSIGCLSFARCELKRELGYQIIDTTAKQLEAAETGSAANEKTPLLG